MSCSLLDMDQRDNPVALSIIRLCRWERVLIYLILGRESSKREIDALARFKQLWLAVDLCPASDALIGRVLETCYDDLPNLRVVHAIKEGLYFLSEDSFSSVSNAQPQRAKYHTLIRIREILHPT
jgi:hypothetical protein